MENLMDWNESYSVKVVEIDEQHKVFINIINRLYHSFMEREHENEIRGIVTEMKQYAMMHFTLEESFFEQYQYADKVEHIKEHQYFLKQIDIFYEGSFGNIKELTPKMMFFLRDWIKNHIIICDQKYVPFLEKAGITQ